MASRYTQTLSPFLWQRHALWISIIFAASCHWMTNSLAICTYLLFNFPASIDRADLHWALLHRAISRHFRLMRIRMISKSVTKFTCLFFLYFFFHFLPWRPGRKGETRREFISWLTKYPHTHFLLIVILRRPLQRSQGSHKRDPA